MKVVIRARWRKESGRNALDYALLAAFVASASGAAIPAAVVTANYLGSAIGALSSRIAGL